MSNVENLLERLDELFVEVRGDYHAAKYVSKEGRRLIREFLADPEDGGRGTYLAAYADEQGCISVRVNGEWVDVEPRDAANARALRKAWTWQPANTEGEREEGDDGL